MADHYSVLGLAPYAEHSAVRAAYVELMRRYHPDINASPEAAARAREVTAAYEVLGNPDSRTDYDLARAHAHAAWAARKSPGFVPPRAIAALAAIAGAGLLAFLLLPRQERVEQTAAMSSPAPTVEKRQGKARAPSRAPAQRAQPAAPLASAEIERAAAPPETPAAAPAPVLMKAAAAPDVKATVAIAAASPPKVRPKRAVAQNARTGEEPDLAALDRHLGMLLRQSVSQADKAKQQSLYRDHYRFIGRLNACATAACKQREYLARMGEVSTTMTAAPKTR